MLNDHAKKVSSCRWQNYVHNIVLETRQQFLSGTRWVWENQGTWKNSALPKTSTTIPQTTKLNVNVHSVTSKNHHHPNTKGNPNTHEISNWSTIYSLYMFHHILVWELYTSTRLPMKTCLTFMPNVVPSPCWTNLQEDLPQPLSPSQGCALVPGWLTDDSFCPSSSRKWRSIRDPY